MKSKKLLRQNYYKDLEVGKEGERERKRDLEGSGLRVYESVCVRGGIQRAYVEKGMTYVMLGLGANSLRGSKPAKGKETLGWIV